MIKFGFLLKLVSQHRSDVMFPFGCERDAKTPPPAARRGSTAPKRGKERIKSKRGEWITLDTGSMIIGNTRSIGAGVAIRRLLLSLSGRLLFASAVNTDALKENSK
ncbi:hypothetical protein MTP99_016372 [Tenebrio molitor]|nr:hypothetical protein MTP99_016372 [Tenebrio molitor]